ncbi:hypothetical protein HNQ91_005140 [Filimonas zeae]|uniref:DUF4843 domain-containing protein n=1 Tax=Filimonas zeae TaxID=1737353 RepID=A0A917MYJ9_9BACT|nr:DUF4843 domain-containing protein [Filimonas zeae]MDR6342063.1 hypothetical protein [Filimonas zeae]GGH79252.1 hypothetical protein GCM10011379_48340 [Filimonas zeae]
MKLHSTKLLYLLIALPLFFSCSKDLGSYDDEPRVYFFERATDVVQSRITSRSFSFLTSPAAVVTDTMKIKVKIMGNTASRNRVVRGRTIATGTTAQEGVHYEFLNGVVPADSIYGYIPVLLRRTADIQQKSVTLNLGIAVTDDFKRGVVEDSTFTITWSDNVVKPSNWDGIISIGYYFGTYSEVKWRFIIQVTGKSSFPLQQSARVPPAPGEYTGAAMLDLNKVLKAALLQYNNTHDPDLTDESGNLVTFPL